MSDSIPNDGEEDRSSLTAKARRHNSEVREVGGLSVDRETRWSFVRSVIGVWMAILR